MDYVETFEIDATVLVDGLIRDCLAANLPPLPAVLAEVLAGILCQRGSRTEYEVCFAQLIGLVRERLEFLKDTSQAPN